MTLTETRAALPPRRVGLILVAVIALTAVYLFGATRSGVSPAAASNSALSPSGGQGQSPGGGVAGVGGVGITVAGTADVAGTPDTLRLDLSVQANRPTVSEALAKANSLADAIQKSLLGNGVAKKDLQTSGLNISPTYDYSKRGVAPRIKGYEVSESVSAKLRDLVRAGDVIGKAVLAGGNAARINGISLDLEETGALVSQARDKAFADARAKAAQYAKAAGRPLGAVVSIAEVVANPSPVSVPQSARLLSGSSAVPVQPGSQSVGVTVTVVYAMG